MIVRKTAYPRAGLIGNPSDGYFGKTISFVFGNFCANITMYETPELEMLPSVRDHSRFESIQALAEDVRLLGYYGGIRLLKAATKKFVDYCRARDIRLHDRNFTVRYDSTIPHMVGLAGSSAIITAFVRGLMEFYGVDIPKPEQANLILSVEREELGIGAGLQDRVAQVYEGLVYMDFSRDVMSRSGHGVYEELDPVLLPNIFIAYRWDLSEGSEVLHNDMRNRFERGDPAILDAVRFWTDLTDKVKACLQNGKVSEIGPLMDANFDMRAKVCRISEGNHQMVAAARSVGASAKFTGSGGAIVGTYEDNAMFAKLEARLAPLNVNVIRPVVVPEKLESLK